MDLPVIAILVASVSALFTGANMLVSFLTYRRTRPRLRVRVRYDVIDRDDLGSEGQWRGVFRVHVVNLGSTDATIVDARLVSRFILNWRAIKGEFSRTAYSAAKFVGQNPDMSVPALGGVHLQIDNDPLLRKLKGKARPVAMTVHVLLSNGHQASGRWISARDLDATDRHAEQIAGLHHLEVTAGKGRAEDQ